MEVNNNGYLTFDQSWKNYTPIQFNVYSGRDIIAPLWTDIDNRANGVISYNQYSNGSVLSQATRDINQYFPGVNFNASWVFVATWDRVAYFNYSGTAGYATDGTDWFTILWSNVSDHVNFSNLSNMSNVNVSGRWAFGVNGRPRDSTTKDITTLTPSNFSTTGANPETNITTDSSFDPCYNYTALDNYWRNTRTNYRGHDDTLVEWKGWYRLYLQGKSAQMSEWCVGYMTCGGFTPLLLRGSHPQIGDGIVTREIIGSRDLTCSYYKSNPVQVKACPGNYYVYKLVKPDVSIPVPSYCAVSFSNSSVDPCYSYTALNEAWRSSTDSTTTSQCDMYVNWVGWYRLFYQGQSTKMPETCVSPNKCGTNIALWLNGSHPRVEDGVVVRQICGNSGSDCCFHKFFPIQVKACPGNYYVYEFVKPNICNAAYCLVPYRLFPILPGTIQQAVTVDGGSTLIQLDYPFFYFGKPHSQLYLSMNGFLSFEPLFPVGYDPSLNKDIIAPLWTKIHIYTRGNISYSQATSGPLVKLAANEISQVLPGYYISVSWVFISTWEKVEFEPDVGVGVSPDN
ncbi:uncharacterized protein LOC108435027 [Pygocentrus nattereri]|uniref:uncharacterized protein LOC108435027 n=1 Tax=Pygocentrus nattereri TaxID=42514 RepID=UPI001891B609|nr:uncharacterized protein LOC108435027 [Pygocentrus nattereri]